jgi:hypothetical protein
MIQSLKDFIVNLFWNIASIVMFIILGCIFFICLLFIFLKHFCLTLYNFLNYENK